MLIAGTSFVARLGGATGYEQPRYLFPLLALYGALIALAARGAGKRYGPAVGVLLVCIAIAHTAAAMLLTLTRYYGLERSQPARARGLPGYCERDQPAFSSTNR